MRVQYCHFFARLATATAQPLLQATYISSSSPTPTPLQTPPAGETQSIFLHNMPPHSPGLLDSWLGIRDSTSMHVPAYGAFLVPKFGRPYTNCNAVGQKCYEVAHECYEVAHEYYEVAPKCYEGAQNCHEGARNVMGSLRMLCGRLELLCGRSKCSVVAYKGSL